MTALSSQSHNTWIANICELIDNSFDAEAASVSVEWGRATKGGADYFKIVDDGRGKDSLLPFFKAGLHEQSSTTEVGQYGVGGTLAQNWICDTRGTTHVVTVCRGDGLVREGEQSWLKIVASDAFTFDEQDERAAAGEECGTAITVIPCERKVPDKGERFANLVSELGFIYASALRAGRQIKIRRNPDDAWTLVRAWALPKLDPGAVDITLTLGRRLVKLKCGIVADGEETTRCGLTYYVGFRSIETTAKGCSDYSTSRIVGAVELSGKDGWPVSTNKDAMKANADTDVLYAAIFDAIHPLLLQAKQKALQMNIASLTDSLSQMINGLVEEAKAKRTKTGEKAGARRPTGKGGKHTQAEVEQEGKTFKSRRGTASQYLIDWHDFGKDDPCIARFDAPKRVVMNTSHPWVTRARDRDDREALLVVAAVTIGAYDKSLDSGQTEFLAGTNVLARAGQVLRRVMAVEQRDLTKQAAQR